MSVSSMALLVLLLLPGTYVGLWSYPSTRWAPVGAPSIQPCIQGGRQGIHFFLCVFCCWMLLMMQLIVHCFSPGMPSGMLVVSQPGGDDGGEPAAYEFESLAGTQGWILDRTLEQAPWPGQEGLPLEECGMDPRAGQPMPTLKRFRQVWSQHHCLWSSNNRLATVFENKVAWMNSLAIFVALSLVTVTHHCQSHLWTIEQVSLRLVCVCFHQECCRDHCQWTLTVILLSVRPAADLPLSSVNSQMNSLNSAATGSGDACHCHDAAAVSLLEHLTSCLLQYLNSTIKISSLKHIILFNSSNFVQAAATHCSLTLHTSSPLLWPALWTTLCPLTTSTHCLI